MQPAACQQNVGTSSSKINVSTPKTSCLQGRTFKIITTGNFEALEKAVLTYQDDEEDRYNAEIRETVKSICSYIKKHENTWNQQVIDSQENLFISSSAELIRSVLYNTDRSIYIHFNKKKKRDHIAGKGSCKIVSLAFNYLSGEVLASSALMGRNAKDEIDGHNLAQQTKALHTLPVKYTVSYTSKKKERKVRILTPYCSGGNLSEAIRSEKLSLEQKKQISIKLIEAVIDWQSKGLLHLDIKPSNIFLTHDKVLVGDLASFCKNDDNTRKNHIRITPWYASPEYVKALLQHNLSKENALFAIQNRLPDAEKKRKISYKDYLIMLANFSEQYDIWSLGCTLYQLHYLPSKRLPWAVSRNKLTVYQAILKLDENWLSEPEKDTIHHLIWSMLRIDPAQRITYKELALKISNNF